MFGNPINAIKAPQFTRDRLDRYRLYLLRRQIEYCAEYVPFYSRVFREIGLTGRHVTRLDILHEIPPVSKEGIRDNYHEFLGRNHPVGKLKKDHTSGSTGQPFWTYYDRPYWIRKKYVSKLRPRVLCGYRPGDKIAKLECESSRALDQKHRRPWSPQKLMRVRNFSMFEDIEKVARAILAYNPSVIDGYPSFLLRLARVYESQQMSLPGLKLLFTGSEYLSAAVRNYLMASFNVQVYDIYGSNEFKEVAWQCRAGNGYHINEDELILEILDHEDNSSDGGEAGQIVITDLLNRAMPLIRYRMQDTGMRLPGKCSCGCRFAMMKPLAGRSSDNIILPDGRTITGYRITTSIEKTPGLRQYQVVQQTPDTLIVKLNVNSDQRDEASRQIDVNLRRVTKDLVTIDIRFCDRIEVEENGKFRVIKSDIGTSSLRSPVPAGVTRTE